MAPRRWFLSAPVALMGILCGCGSIGEPLPPSLSIPIRIGDLGAYQKGGQLIIDFTAPATTTDGVGIRRLRDLELRLGPEGPQWEASSKRIETGRTTPGPVHIEIPAAEWTGREIAVRARAQSAKGRYGEWSNTAVLTVLAPLAQPVVRAETAPNGVKLSWNSAGTAGVSYRMLRSTPETPKPQLIGESQAVEFTDSQAQFGTAYTYAVQAYMKSGSSEVQSEVSQPVTITPEDKFPPAVPSGLTAVAGVSSIDLSWSPDAEPDLRGYYLYRSVGDQPLARLSGIIDSPSYSDRAIESGKQYRYAVSAVDQNGNESGRSEQVEATAP